MMIKPHVPFPGKIMAPDYFYNWQTDILIVTC